MDIFSDDDASGAAESFAGVASRRLAAGNIQRRGQHDLRQRKRGLDQRLSHPAPGAGNGEPDGTHRQGTGGADGLPMRLNQSMILPTNPPSSPNGSSGNAFVAATRFSSCTDLGNSSPSQRVSRSSLK